ncbi:MAG TPA: hypothetical protein VEJ38_00735 [Candidatus Acidoferrales bacterium]|nr:hypothetical protein [Candidatus Acidoferrales bacterium]
MNGWALKFKTPELGARLQAFCERVIHCFDLPSLRLLCFFDDATPEEFDELLGSLHRGFHVPVLGSGNFWPSYVQPLFTDELANFIYDNVIYLNGRTTPSIQATVITFAHELQHFAQCGHMWKVWRANSLIQATLRDGPPTSLKSWDIPYEIDAMLASKRVAEKVLGGTAVKAHALAQIQLGGTKEEWEFFDRLSQRPFDLLEESKPWVEEYRAKLQLLKQNDVDFTVEEWWK